jgi:sn-glycerol 3-phosphate transport system ATP-binding protein
MAEVRLDDVRKSFGPTEVIKGVTTRIDDGEMRVVLGPSGCGKSTVLRMIAGLEEVTRGEIRIGERVVNRLEPKDRDIAMVFQNYALYPHMSVYDNMAYGLRNRGTPHDEVDRRVRHASQILGLSELLSRKPRQLSGGQRQRVAMGRAIVREPAVFLFDEPLSNLDAKLRVQMRIEIKQLQQRLNTTGIYVTHDQTEAMTLGDRLMIMNEGRIEQIGTPIEVYERPASVFVGGFIGSPAMNFLDARMSPEGDSLRIGRRVVDLAHPLPRDAARNVRVGLRPEHLEPVDEDRADLMVQVDLAEVLGADTVIHGSLDDGAAMTVRLPGSTQVRAGERVPVRFECSRLHVFDASGTRISTAYRAPAPG